MVLNAPRTAHMPIRGPPTHPPVPNPPHHGDASAGGGAAYSEVLGGLCELAPPPERAWEEPVPGWGTPKLIG